MTRYGYDTESHLTDIYDAKNNRTQFWYGDGGLLGMVIFPSGDYELHSFSNNQKLLFGMTDRNGNYHTAISMTRKTGCTSG